jgi:glycosyltransferase involved in cell wall biosynthesis
VSAVIPVYNGEDFLADAVASVLAQTHPVLECIVVDDGSTDSTGRIATDFGASVQLVRQARAGVSVARNHGAELARGELVAFLDHDDVWLPTKLERQLELLADERNLMAMCGIEVIDSRGEVMVTKRLAPSERLLTGMLLFDGTETLSCSSTGIVRRDALRSIGGFDPGLSTSADWDLLLRMLLEGRVASVDEPLVRYRVHEKNMSRRVSLMERDMRRAYDKAFAHPALPAPLRRRRGEAYGRLYRMLSGSYRDHGQYIAAARTLARGIRHDRRLLIELARRPPSLRPPP